MDDFYIYGPPSQVFPVFDRFSASLPAAGLTLNLPKSMAFLPDDHKYIFRECASRHLPFSSDYLPALGSVISRNPDTISQWLVDQVETLHKPFFSALLDPRLPTQHAFSLLRSCLVPRMNYWSRTTSPSTFAAAAAVFDRLVVDTFCSRLKLAPLSDVARSQLSLPVRFGGFGLLSVRIVSHAAWFCAFASAFPSIRPLFTDLDSLPPATPL